jgi:hypothetical protein
VSALAGSGALDPCLGHWYTLYALAEIGRAHQDVREGMQAPGTPGRAGRCGRPGLGLKCAR